MHSRWFGVTLLATALLPAACGWADDGGRDHDPANRPGYAAPADRTAGGQRGHTVTGSANGLSAATLALVSSSDAVRVRATDLGGDLYRVSTPDDAKAAPSAHLDNGTVTVGLADTGLKGPAIVTVELSRSVHWTVRLGGGASEEIVDLTAAPPGNVEFAAGTTRAEVSLPPAKGTVTVTMSGGAGQLLVHLNGTAPVQVRVGNGAGSVTVDGQTRSGVGGNTVIAPSGWATASDRYDVQATAGVSNLTVDRRG